MHLPLHLFFIFICSSSITIVSCIPRRNYAQTRCLERDRTALLQFKQGLVDDYALLKSWRNTSISRECCLWRGVRCSNNTGQVIELDLPAVWSDELEQNLGLSGEIGSSLLSLTSLRYLDLSGNSFTRIPKFLGSLKSLQHLIISGIELTSPAFPYELGNLTNLQTLDLSGTSVLIKNTDWLSRLSSLKYLNLSYIDLSDSIGLLNNAIRLPSLVDLRLATCFLPHKAAKPFLGSMTNLSDSFAVLDINFNYLPASMIYPWLFNFSSSLVDINLSDNELLGTIPEAFGAFKTLRTLDLTNNGLEGGVPRSFGNLSEIRELFLGNNLNQDLPSLFDNLYGPGPRMSLQALDLYGNQLSGSLPDFTTFTGLKELHLGRNQLNGSFPGKFEHISSLLILDLADNRINGLLPDLSALASLRELYFERNLLHGTIAERLEPLSKLEALGASSNFFQGTIFETHLANLSRLTYLDLSYNSLGLEIISNWSATFQLDTISLSSCKLGNTFPGWLKTQRNFSVLDISNAGINDSIPSWFWESLNPGIRYLNLSSNHIHGMIPDITSGNIPLIDMSSNNFSGKIPFFPLDTITLVLNNNMFSGPISALCNLTRLHHLDISNNKLSGKLPNCWNTLNYLSILNLEDNGFTGEIPDSMGDLKFVTMMSMRGNSLTGELPLSLRNCTSLVLLDVGENELSGKIPGWLGERLSMLLVLSLPSNQFHGAIPTSLCKLKNLQILDLSVNNFSGNIPKCLNNILGMTTRNNGTLEQKFKYNTVGLERTRLTVRGSFVFKVLLQWKGRQSEYQNTLVLVVSLDLSGNRLIGEIPDEITSLLGLLALNLSRNMLTGPIPQDIGRLGQLDFLDLSRNELVGGIPTSLSQLNYLGFLDLSFNSLSGRIPKSTQLQSFEVSSYAGNLALCGVPLPNVCPGDEPRSKNSDVANVAEQESDNDKFNKGFIVGIVAGFTFGFWGIWGSLVLSHSWRHAYFRIMNVIKDWFVLRLELSFARLQRQFSLQRSN